MEFIEQHYKTNFNMLVKRFTRPAQTVWNAEDVVQTAYERAMKYFGTYDPSSNFDKWFSGILRNSLIDTLNEELGIVYEELDEFAFPATSYVEYDVLIEVVEEMIGKEPEDNQPILELHFLKGFKAKDIYEFNKFSYPNTRKIIQRFRDKLKKEIME